MDLLLETSIKGIAADYGNTVNPIVEVVADSGKHHRERMIWTMKKY